MGIRLPDSSVILILYSFRDFTYSYFVFLVTIVAILREYSSLNTTESVGWQQQKIFFKKFRESGL